MTVAAMNTDLATLAFAGQKSFADCFAKAILASSLSYCSGEFCGHLIRW
jgi:hypothetical protein